jgi:plastocyanin
MLFKIKIILGREAESMRTSAAGLLLVLMSLPLAARAADAVFTIGDDGRFTPPAITMHAGDRLVVVNHSKKNQFVYGQSGNYAFDYRATDENLFTHKPGESLAVTMQIPGKYHIGSLDPSVEASVVVEP